MKIDFVIPWVNGGDPAWRKEKYAYMACEEPEAGDHRYRDMGLLKYWFRTVEAYAPWVNRIHFVTWGHLPEWLNTDNPKLHVVNHKDYIPEEWLPTFSSHPIELNFHRIPGLSEHFVYFNDDMFLNAPIGPEFFFRKALPCDSLRCASVDFAETNDIYAHTIINSIVKVNQRYSYIKLFLRQPWKVINFKYDFKTNITNLLKLGNIHHYIGLYNHHLPNAYTKKTFQEVWEAMPETMEKVSQNRFRTPFDVNQYIFSYWQLASGKFFPVSEDRGVYLRVMDRNDHVTAALNEPKVKMICINDTTCSVDFEQAIAQIVAEFEKKLPQKSSFEK